MKTLFVDEAQRNGEPLWLTDTRQVRKRPHRKFHLVGARQLDVALPLPLVKVWEELQLEVKHLTGLAGLKIILAAIMGPRHQPDPTSSCVRWGQQPYTNVPFS